MELTGKCLDDAKNHPEKKLYSNWDEFLQLPESFQQTRIIDFFDLSGIYILIDTSCNEFYYIIKEKQLGSEFPKKYISESEYDERINCYNAAIKHANHIYNSKKILWQFTTDQNS